MRELRVLVGTKEVTDGPGEGSNVDVYEGQGLESFGNGIFRSVNGPYFPFRFLAMYIWLEVRNLELENIREIKINDEKLVRIFRLPVCKGLYGLPINMTFFFGESHLWTRPVASKFIKEDMIRRLHQH